MVFLSHSDNNRRFSTKVRGITESQVTDRIKAKKYKITDEKLDKQKFFQIVLFACLHGHLCNRNR